VATGGELVVQRAVRALFRSVLAAGTSPAVETSRLRRVLVVRTDDRVGNVLLTTPLLRALREGLPHARVDFLLADRRRVLVEGLGLADRLIGYDKRRSLRNPLVLGPLLTILRAARYDAVIDAAHYDAFSLTAALLTRWTGAPVRIGHARGDAERFYTHPIELAEGLRYDVAAKLSLLSPLRVPARGYGLETSAGLDRGTIAAADETLARLGLVVGRYFVLNPGARKADRRVARDRLAGVVRAIAAKTGLRALVVWGPGEEELAGEVVQGAPESAVRAPPTDLPLLSALLRRSALLVTNDTGPMHLGVACGAPVVALFNIADSVRWGHPLPTFAALERAGERSDVAEAAAEAAMRVMKAHRAGRVS
jgi:ADP-heptose:LPS heptosyltransferase